VLVNSGSGPATHGAVALQFDVVGQFAVVAERVVLVLKPGTNEATETTARRNGRMMQVLSFKSPRYREELREHIAAAVNVLSNAAEFTVCRFNSA
jgi:hypothetical protein